MRTLWWLIPAAVAAASAGAGPERVVPAINDLDRWQQVGQQPYEMTWVQREEDPRTLVDFEDLQGWTVEFHGGASGEFRRSREQQMWGQSVAKFLFSGAGPASRLVARPPRPIPIPGEFDSVDLWGYGNRWSWIPDPSTPAAEVNILIRDARGTEHTVPLTDIRWKQWWLIHRKLPPKLQSGIALPASFSGIEIAKIGNRDPRHFYCDSLAFYTEVRRPLKFKPQPKRNLKPYRGQVVGLNTGEGVLPFPTREETILPANLERNFRTTVRQVGPGHFELRYEGNDATVVYEYRPRTGDLSELTAKVNGAAALQPLAGGGVRLEGRTAGGKLLGATLSGDAIEAKFQYDAHQVDYTLRLWQKSLVLDVWCDGGKATELSFGRVAGAVRPRLITIPYLTYGVTNPRVLLSGDAAHPVFTSVWFDWYRSNGSEPYCSRAPKVDESSAEINGGMKYTAKTDGRRNNLYERIFVTNSPLYEETLPTIANPPSLRQEEGKQVVWTVGRPRTFQEEHRRCRMIRSYGLDKVMQHTHEVTWRDEGDSFTLRLKPAPQKGGDGALRRFVQAQNAMGWRQGVYSNYTDFATVNTNWSPDHVLRTADGEWQRAWPRNYVLKPAKAVEFDEYYARRIQEKFGTRMSYTDVHSAVPPWRYCDYDARVPGAGTFAATYYAYGQILLNDQRVYGPAQSEGTYQWLYAGLQSGGYGWVYTGVNLLKAPLDVAFKLHKIQPLECDYGMGYTQRYLNEIDPDWFKSTKKHAYVDLYLATAIGYGNMGWLVNEVEQPQPHGYFVAGSLDDSLYGVELMARSYYMMQQLQQQYAFLAPARIEYADGAGRWYSPSQAHASGVIADSRLHLVYPNGTEVYVNRSSAGNWTVRDHRGTPVELPVSGWLAFNRNNGFYEISANVEGHRIDHVQARDYEFLDGRGQWTGRGTLRCAGGVARRPRDGGAVELIDIGNRRIGFRAGGSGALTAYDPDGKELQRVSLSSPQPGWHEFETVTGARSYVYRPAGR